MSADRDAWAIPDWAYTKEDGTFGNRFDDPMGAGVAGEYVDIYALKWVSHPRTALAEVVVKLGMEDIDLSSLERAEPRRLTRQASRIAFELGHAKVFYHSRYGHSIENWAILEDCTMSERLPVHQPNSRKISEDDPDLIEALRADLNLGVARALPNTDFGHSKMEAIQDNLWRDRSYSTT